MKVLVLSSFTKSLIWFRLDLLVELVGAGHDVYALGSDDDNDYRDLFKRLGVTYDSFHVSRNGLSVAEDLRTYRELRAVIKEIAPDKVLAYQAKPIVYGCPAAKSAGVPEVYSLVAGLGSVFRGDGLRDRLVRIVLKAQYKNAFRLCKSVFFQNEDDRHSFVSLGLLPQVKTAMLNGSGVNLDHFTEAPLPEDAVFLFVGRLLRDKGLIEYLDACTEIRRRHPGCRCLLVGPYDSNLTAIQPHDLKPYIEAGVVEYFGEQTDVRPHIAESSVFVLPSYHEGTPKSVLEAMAMGRPIVTTDAPGCRETVVDGVNGYLVEPRNTQALVQRMESFIGKADLMARMGKESRRMAEERFDVHKVNRAIMETMGM